MKHIAIYKRVSTRDQNLESQSIEIDRYIQAMYPYDQTREYADAFTGRQMKRPGMDELLCDVRAGKVERIIVLRLDRLGRTAKGLHDLFSELEERGVDLVSIRDSFDLRTPTGKLQAAILAAVGQYETEVRAERQAAGIEAAKARTIEARRLHQEEYWPIPAIARQLRLTEKSVERILRGNSAVYWGGKGTGRRRKPAPRAEIERLQRSGLTQNEIAKVLGISRSSICRRLSEMRIAKLPA